MEIITTTIISGVVAIITGLSGFFFGRRRNDILVAKEQLAHFMETEDHYIKKIDTLIAKNDELEKSFYKLRSLVILILKDACVKKGCLNREHYGNEFITKILGE